ncbi:hypothetical protein QQ045_004435 [Rhodiola kirilowii]
MDFDYSVTELRDVNAYENYFGLDENYIRIGRVRLGTGRFVNGPPLIDVDLELFPQHVKQGPTEVTHASYLEKAGTYEQFTTLIQKVVDVDLAKFYAQSLRKTLFDNDMDAKGPNPHERVINVEEKKGFILLQLSL